MNSDHNFDIDKINSSSEVNKINDVENNIKINNKSYEIYQTKILKIPYFYHGNTLNFYLPYTKITSDEFKYPFFSIGNNKILFPIVILIVSTFFSFLHFILNKLLQIGFTIKNITLIILILSIILAILLYLLNPGIIYQSHIKNIQNIIHCKICDIKYDKSLKGRHCHRCNVCVSGFDHHCNLLAKCVGRINFIIFYVVIFFAGILQWIYIYHIGKLIYIYYYKK